MEKKTTAKRRPAGLGGGPRPGIGNRGKLFPGKKPGNGKKNPQGNFHRWNSEASRYRVSSGQRGAKPRYRATIAAALGEGMWDFRRPALHYPVEGDKTGRGANLKEHVLPHHGRSGRDLGIPGGFGSRTQTIRH